MGLALEDFVVSVKAEPEDLAELLVRVGVWNVEEVRPLPAFLGMNLFKGKRLYPSALDNKSLKTKRFFI